jgi:hypothetical protein
MIEKPSFSSRRLIAATSIMAPPERVWEALTDYDGLGNFIPSLVENRCIERRERGALLYQVRQPVASGARRASRTGAGVRAAAAQSSWAHQATCSSGTGMRPSTHWWLRKGWGQGACMGAAGCLAAAR